MRDDKWALHSSRLVASYKHYAPPEEGAADL